MAQLQIIWSKTATTQRREVFEYWNKRNGNTKYSLKLLRSIQSRMKLISIYPEMGVKTDFNEVFVAHLGNYSIFYRIKESLIQVALFWDNRQDPEKIARLLG